MIISVLLFVCSFVLMPSISYAWGPLTHIYLGNELLALGSLLPPAIYEIIRRYRKDFLYGNLMADIIIGKKYLPDSMSSHSWEVAFELLEEAKTPQQKSFVYGYLCHLAADTVAHNVYTVDRKNISHTLIEMKADSIVDKKYWLQAIAIDKATQVSHDVFLEEALPRFVFSFKTNKRILKSMLLFSVVNQERIGDFIDRRLATTLPDRTLIEGLHQESLDKMIELIQKLHEADVVKTSPSGPVHKGRIVKAFLQLNADRQLRSPFSWRS